MHKIKKTTVNDVIKTLESKNSTPCPLKEARELKCDFFKKFLAQEIKKNEDRKALIPLDPKKS